MKKLGGFISLIVALVLVYTVFWFYQANHVKKIVVYHLNEYAKADAKGYHVKVDEVSVQGYPLNYEVKLLNPKYEMAQDTPKAEQNLRAVVDGAIKIGTDIFGRSYWVKQEGDINYGPIVEGENVKKYSVHGNLRLKADVVHPQYTQAFFHPFYGLPKVFYKEKPTFQELLNELKMASYEDHDFGLYEIDNSGKKQLLSFTKGLVQWKHDPLANEEEKFVFNLDLKDFEAAEDGKPLLPHLKKLMELNTDMTVDVPYILSSGKNNIALDFNATLPQNFDFLKFFSYKNIDIVLRKFEIENLFGHTSAKFDINLKEADKDSRNFHLGVNAESLITDKGSEALHRQFIDSLKLKVAAQPSDPENKVLLDLLKCCEDRLQDIIPNYSKLGKMQFVFDTDVRVKNIAQETALDKVIVNHLDALAQPYGVKSHGLIEISDNKPQGRYEIKWINYKEMIQDAVAYYNRIHPIVEKFSEDNQPLAIGLIDAPKEKEIIDFFKSISDNPSNDDKTITITINFTDMNNIKVGQNSLEQVRDAWNKLIADIMKVEPKPAEEASKTEEPKKDEVPDTSK